MEPEYPVGSLIYVASVEPEEVSIGDAITFELGSGTLVTHQVYEVDQANRQFNTQGIANKTGDGEIVHDAQPVPYERLVGKPVLCIPFLGYLNSLLTGRAGLFIIAAALLLMLAAAIGIELIERSEADHTPIGSHMRR